jgi:hypothetical protein
MQFLTVMTMATVRNFEVTTDTFNGDQECISKKNTCGGGFGTCVCHVGFVPSKKYHKIINLPPFL